MGRWGDGEMGEIFIKGNYHNMILAFYCAKCFCQSEIHPLMLL
ncbi:hypothetical protein [Moorena sp. SIO3I8]|nr:hypothetical protein [Moorena sp. SIO3I8]